MTKVRITLLAALAAALVLVAAACGGGESGGSEGAEDTGTETAGGGPSGEPITIGMALGLTGYLADFDAGVKLGAELAVEQLNADGGVLDRPVEVEILDMKSDPQQGVQAVQKLITGSGAVALANGFSSAATAAAAPIAMRSKVPLVVASVLPEPDTEWAFSTIPPAGFETGVRIEYLSSVGAKSVGILYDASPYAEVQLTLAKEQLQQAGIAVAGVEKHASDATDLRSQLNGLLSKRPDAILKFGAGPSTLIAAKNMDVLGATIPILMSIDDFAVFEPAAAAYDQVLFAAAPAQVYDRLAEARRPEALTSFMSRVEEGGISRDPTYVGRGWDAVYLLANAIEEAGSDDGAAIRDALESMGPYDATTGTYDFTGESHYGIAKNPMVLARIQGGEVEIVYEPKG